MEDLKYPIGRFQFETSPGIEKVEENIRIIKTLPEELVKEVNPLTDAQINTPYRDGGWTVKQVVHHIGDSHINAFIRFKLALTEDNPTIKPYLEAKWAEMEDYKIVPVSTSLKLIESLHERWYFLLNSMKQDDFEKTFYHPESKRTFKLSESLSLYSWHSRHHLAHITQLKKRMNW